MSDPVASHSKLRSNFKSMETNDLRTLKILEELDSDHAPSQRDLAKSLGVSLGLVNSFLKRLVNMGYFKVTTIPKNRVRYILTPKGAAEKTRLTYEYIGRSYRYYKDARQRLRTIFEQFEKQRINRVVFWGAGELSEIAFISLQETDIELAGIVDPLHAGEKLLGFRVSAPESLPSMYFDRVVVTAATDTGDVVKQILNMGILRSKIILL